jgi:hypothetical protein
MQGSNSIIYHVDQIITKRCDVYEGIEKSLQKPMARTLPQSGSRFRQGHMHNIKKGNKELIIINIVYILFEM